VVRVMAAAGYSGTPLPKKLGLKDGQFVAFIGRPDRLDSRTYMQAFASLERVAEPAGFSCRDHDFVHMFSQSAGALSRALPALREKIRPAGMIWISWPKKAAKLATDVSENLVRALPPGLCLVDVKVCLVNAIWSGLKLVIRKELCP
jgi:hypothetical protein